MKTAYKDLNIRIVIEQTTFLTLNIVCEQFTRAMPKHSHGSNSYEVHYIPHGHGTLYINNQTFPIIPNTLYMTGPHVEHEQIPARDDPMVEYCIYFKLENSIPATATRRDGISYKFTSTPFWFGQDTQALYPLMQQLFYELEHQFSGYTIQVESLLQQCVVKLVRNYENMHPSRSHFPPSNLGDSKYIVVEESFLYEFETITLDNLSARLGLSNRQTERFLKSYYGKTFIQKKADAKMSMAKILLNDSALTISDIAERLNYSTVQHFSYAFKQYYGISASSYRKTRII